MQKIEVRLLGEFSIKLNGAALEPLNSTRFQSLLGFLILHREAPQPRRKLAYMFWPDSADSQARTNLRKLLYDLRKALPEIETVLALSGPKLDWRQGIAIQVDVEAFEEALRDSTDTDQKKQALRLYSGELMPGCYDDWIFSERQRLEQLFISSLEELDSQLEKQRQYNAAINYAQRLLQLAPLQEENYRRLMRLYALVGDRAGVARTYQACASELQRELEIEPGPLTRQLYDRLLEMGDNLAQLPPPAPPLIGRTAEWAELQAAWAKAIAQQPQWVLLSGEDGIGKTRLAEELVQWGRRQGIAIANARCYPTDTNQAFAPLAALFHSQPVPALNKIWLSELARLVPEILIDHPQVEAPQPIHEAWQRQRFFEALARALLSRQPILVFLDDLHWCDADTLQWLAFLLHFDLQAKLLCLTTLNAAELPANHPLPALLASLRQNGQLTEIELEPLTQEDTLRLATDAVDSPVDQSNGNPFNPEIAARFYRKTQGNPLLATEFARIKLHNPPQADNLEDDLDLHAAMRARLTSLSPSARELTGLAATLGRAFNFDLMAHISGTQEEDLLHSLDELWRQQILQANEFGIYDFSHQKLSEITYNNLDEPQRQMLHQRIAQALEDTSKDDLKKTSGEIAFHYEKSGQRIKAAQYYRLAGDAAREVYANQAAIDYYQHGAQLVPENEKIGLLFKLGEVHQLTGDLNAAEQLYHQVRHLAGRIQDLHTQANATAALGEVDLMRGRQEAALMRMEQAYAQFKKLNDQPGVAKVLSNLGRIYLWKLDYQTAMGYFQELLTTAKHSGDKKAVAIAHGSLGKIYWQLGDFENALVNFTQKLRIAEEIADLQLINRTLSYIGRVHWAQGHHTQAKTYFKQELQFAREIGDQLGVCYALGNFGDYHRVREEYILAHNYYTQQLSIAQNVGDQANISHAIRNMGVIYAELGEYSRALACYAHGLQIVLESGMWIAIGRTLGNIALVFSAQGIWDQAEQVFQKAIQLLPETALPYRLCKYLYHLASLYFAQNRLAAAQTYNLKALELARQVGRKDIQLHASLLAFRIEAASHPGKLVAARQKLTLLLSQWTAEADQAAIQFELWKSATHQPREAEENRQRSAVLYARLYRNTYRAQYRQRYQELTGESLAAPESIPPLPEGVALQDIDLNELIDRAGQLTPSIMLKPTEFILQE